MNIDTVAYRNLTIIGAVMISIGALWILLARDWVKSDLRKNNCKPITVRWLPFANLIIWKLAFLGPGFKVIYRDYHGATHKAYCWVSNIEFRKVRWLSDEIVSTKPRA